MEAAVSRLFRNLKHLNTKFFIFIKNILICLLDEDRSTPVTPLCANKGKIQKFLDSCSVFYFKQSMLNLCALSFLVFGKFFTTQMFFPISYLKFTLFIENQNFNFFKF